ncbi:MAG TPA: PAS domain S-box protein, partial [Chitinophagaceae bacterium]|nr:PAS domain S-box protein [Chitinophagaceae bacterium]
MNLAQKSHLLQELFNHATESIIAINNQGDIQLVNPATEKLFGYKQEELYGKKVEFLMPERFKSSHIKHRDGYASNPHSRSMGIGYDLYATKKNGQEFPVEISLSPFESDDKKFTMAFVVDISKRKEVELEIINHQKKLEHITDELKITNEKLEAKVYNRTKVLQEALI